MICQEGFLIFKMRLNYFDYEIIHFKNEKQFQKIKYFINSEKDNAFQILKEINYLIGKEVIKCFSNIAWVFYKKTWVTCSM